MRLPMPQARSSNWPAVDDDDKALNTGFVLYSRRLLFVLFRREKAITMPAYERSNEPGAHDC